MLVTRMPRDSRIAARDAAAMPLPREETTPPVTKTYLVIYRGRVGMEEFTRDRAAAQTRFPPRARVITIDPHIASLPRGRHRKPDSRPRRAPRTGRAGGSRAPLPARALAP